MKSRSKKYMENVKEKSKSKNKEIKGAEMKTQDILSDQNTLANQDDTGGGNDSGKRSDEN